MDAFFKFARLATGGQDAGHDAAGFDAPPRAGPSSNGAELEGDDRSIPKSNAAGFDAPPRAGPSSKGAELEGDDRSILKSSERPHKAPSLPSQIKSEKHAANLAELEVVNPTVSKSANESFTKRPELEPRQKSTHMEQDLTNDTGAAPSSRLRCSPENRVEPTSDAVAFAPREDSTPTSTPRVPASVRVPRAPRAMSQAEVPSSCKTSAPTPASALTPAPVIIPLSEKAPTKEPPSKLSTRSLQENPKVMAPRDTRQGLKDPIAKVSREKSKPEAPSSSTGIPTPAQVSAKTPSPISVSQESSKAVKLTVRLPVVAPSVAQNQSEGKGASPSATNRSKEAQPPKGTDSSLPEACGKSAETKRDGASNDSYATKPKRQLRAETPVHIGEATAKPEVQIPNTSTVKTGVETAPDREEMRSKNYATAAKKPDEPRGDRAAKKKPTAKSKSKSREKKDSKAPKKEKQTAAASQLRIPKNPYDAARASEVDAARREQLDRGEAADAAPRKLDRSGPTDPAWRKLDRGEAADAAHRKRNIQHTATDAAASQKKSYLSAALKPSCELRPLLTDSTQNEEHMKVKGHQNSSSHKVSLAPRSHSLVRPIPKPRANPPRPWPHSHSHSSRFPPPSEHLDQAQAAAPPRSSASASSHSINNISQPNRPSAFDRVYSTKPKPKSKAKAKSRAKQSVRERIGARVAEAEMVAGESPRVISRFRVDTDSVDAQISDLEQELRNIEQKLTSSIEATDASTLRASPEASKRRPTSLLNRMEGIKAFTEMARMRKRECELRETVHKLTGENEAITQRERILAKSAGDLQAENMKLKERASLLEMLYLEQVDVAEEQAKVVDELRQAQAQAEAAESYSYQRPRPSHSAALAHMREDFGRLQNSYHNLAAENSMLHTQLKALTSSFRVASQRMHPQAQAQPQGQRQRPVNERVRVNELRMHDVSNSAPSVRSTSAHSMASRSLFSQARCNTQNGAPPVQPYPHSRLPTSGGMCTPVPAA